MVLDNQTLDDVKRFHLGMTERQVGQVPTRRWGSTSNAATPIEHPVTPENPADGPDARDAIHDMLVLQGFMDCLGTVEPERTVLP
jgi:hypothetical protein